MNFKDVLYKRHSLWVAAFVSFLSSGCASISMPEMKLLDIELPKVSIPYLEEETRYLNSEISDVPFFAQQELQCGPAALATILNFQGIGTTPDELTKEVFLPGREGTLQTDLIAGTRRFGLLPYPIETIEALQAAIQNRQPVLVLLNLSLAIYPQWHYAVVVGYENGNYLLRSGQQRREIIKDSTFLRLWKRSNNWSFVALPLNTKPPTFTEPDSWLEASVGLERTSSDNAILAYTAGAERWTNDARFPFALGNVMYQTGQAEEAVSYFQKAIDLDPEYADAWNNLAEAYWATDRRFKAYLAVQEAQAIGGTRLMLYNATEKRFIEIEAEEKKSTSSKGG